MKLSVEYFAALRECAAKQAETLETHAATALELYLELDRRYGFPLRPAHINVAVNGSFARMDTALQDGDVVVFIPPIAGG